MRLPETGQGFNPKQHLIGGEWHFDLDRQDTGVAEVWLNQDLSGTIQLPGTISTRNLGDPIKEIRQQIWGANSPANRYGTR